MSTTRRDFLKTATTAALGGAMVQSTSTAFAGQGLAGGAGSDAIRVGVIGCGGRGTGAVDDAISSSPGVTLVAMGDMFADRLTESRTRLTEKFGAKIDVGDRAFTGLDAYKKVIASDVNYIILATPPGFRPLHLTEAINAGKHIFTEKPVAVDGPGIRAVFAAGEQAKAKGLGIAAGTQRRHQTGYLEAMKRIHDGAVGKIVSARCYWNQGGLWKRDRQPEWTDAEWQIRNWLYFAWLSGDHIVEQHVHNIDVVNWAMNAHPVSANGMGGRQVRTGPEYGHIFDHFAIDYEYENGTPLASQCRQIQGCANNVTESLVGEKGTVRLDNSGKYSITGAKAWTFDGKDNRPYVQEHTDFIAAIRAGKPYNELKAVAESTLTAIMGRMSAYTGKVVTWDQALNSKEDLMPANLTLGPLPTPPVAVPGQTPLV